MDVQQENKKTSRVLLSEINVTPFVDVMLVLLIIFMVTAPMMQQGLDIELPETAGAGITIPDEPLILTIKKNKKIFIGSAQIPISQLGKKTAAILRGRKDKQVYIQADKSVEYGVVAEALAEIRSMGLYQVSLITTFKGK
ncbi:MAG: ExbD/TolR family protein [Oligoflexia bacterium]|nr:ExbD/TolR family protein [Bdellovibrionales bacterium]MYE07923.1 ExbD/TolR family protein [Oligoflexia bacterium]